MPGEVQLMNTMFRPWLWVPLLLLVWASCGFYAGDQHRNNAWLIKQAAQQREALANLEAAQARGDVLSAGLLAQQTQIDQLKQEARHAITQATTGRTCFDAAALRVLDRTPGVSLVPAPASSTAATGGAAAGAGGDASTASTPGAVISTDTQVALWVVDAAAAFEVCRTRLDSLIDWHASSLPTGHTPDHAP
jgi:N-acetylglutamate synthase/N-acetylornithine aminotransferase